MGTSLNLIFYKPISDQARTKEKVEMNHTLFSLQSTSENHTYSWPSISSVQFSRSVVSDSLQPHGQQHTRPPCPSPIPGVYSNSCLLNQWCNPTISSSIIPFSSTFNLSQYQGLFQWASSSHQMVKVLEFQLQHQFFQWIFRTDFL